MVSEVKTKVGKRQDKRYVAMDCIGDSESLVMVRGWGNGGLQPILLSVHITSILSFYAVKYQLDWLLSSRSIIEELFSMSSSN